MDETEAIDKNVDAGEPEAASGDAASVELAADDAVPDAVAAGDAASDAPPRKDPSSRERDSDTASEASATDQATLDAVEAELTEELEAARSHEAVDADVELQALRGELEVLQDRYLRTRAEYDNYRKRTALELQTVWGRAQADMVESFLEALDDLQRVGTWDQSSTDLKALIEGVDLVERKFSQALGRAGIEAIDPLGEVFDPNTMEAMMKVPVEEEGQEDLVAEVFQKGYVLKGTLIRAARVGVYTAD